jgi:succinoglycan biosynthesis protein ExoO
MDDSLGFQFHEDADCWTIARPPLAESVAATIVIPNYRAAATLNRALLSALGQTLRDIEVIVVDDASPDGSWDIVVEAMRHDSRLRGIRHKRNCGKPVGMNRAIACARGRWLAVLDADDWYHPERLAALVALGERSGADLVADNQFFFDSSAAQTVGTAWRESDADWELSFDAFLAGSNAYESFNLGMLKPVLRTDFMRRTGLGYEEKARHGQDFFHLLDFFLRGGKAAVADRAYYYYTQPFGAVSRQWSHAARRRYDFQTACDINQRYLLAARKSLTPLQRAYLKKRSNRLKSLEIFFQVRERLAARDPAGALGRVLRHPSTLGYLARRLRHRWIGQSASATIDRLAARAPRVAPERAAQVSVGTS